MASYTPTSTSGNDYTKTLQAGDIIHGTAGQTIPITVPAGRYELECYGAQGGYGQTISTTSSGTYWVSVDYNDLGGDSYSSVSMNNVFLDVRSGNGVSYRQVSFYSTGYYILSIIKGETSNLLTITCNGSNIISTYESTSVQFYYNAGDIILMQLSNYGVNIDYGTASINAEYQQESPGQTIYGTPQPGGYGGYSKGTLNLKKSTTLYLATGTQNGYNGGGAGNSYYGTYGTIAGSGGGGSDIRIGDNNLYARVIVAGGGGGSAGYDNATAKAGGGETGHLETGHMSAGYIGKQTEAGYNGGFGYGAVSYGSGYYFPGGGGGGWYGGGSHPGFSNSDSTIRNANGGGSGYVYTSSTASNYPSNCLLNSNYYLSDAITESSTHTGNGSITITLIELTSQKFFYYKTAAGWKPAIAIFKKSENGWQGGEI